MEVITQKKLQLTVHPEEFDISFAWNRKRGVEKDYWFTPTGKCKIWIGGLHTNTVGKVQPEIYKELVKQLKKNKTELFTWGSQYFTVSGDDEISEIYNMSTILYQATNEWNKRKYVEYWVEEQI